MIWGIVLQMILGLLILRTEAGKTTFSFLGKQVEHFQSHVLAGVTFVFGEKYSDFEFIFKVYFNQTKIRWVFFLSHIFIWRSTIHVTGFGHVTFIGPFSCTRYENIYFGLPNIIMVNK